ncbi:MAG: polysaccharide biosynthesis C-terminal domain-containing protein [Deltaproteobacteria bacterium]|nr:polysaccharide biosynthesis C-terminal domain-containing protein [Deltaproteobacteria bacterium]
MGFKPQTAIRGVASVAAINLTARVIAFGKHIVITAYIGLSAQLDAFYVATAVLSLVIFIFGDIFDSLGIPRLVKTLQEEGEEEFRSLAGSIFSFSLVLSAVLCLLLFLVAPWTPWIAPGFSPEKKELVLRNLYFLAPMAILYLPYHAIGSFLRAKRRFQAFYIGELIIASSTFMILFVWHDLPYVIPISFSAAYMIIFAYVVAVGMREVRFGAGLGGEKIRGIVRLLFSLLPLYLTGYIFTLVDRAFASFLVTGGVSALSYGALIAMIPCSILMFDSIFITPLSESADREPLMNDILCGVLIVSVPITFFTAFYANQIVKAAFERGVFSSASTLMTGDALAFLSLAIPAFFTWPIFYRLFQVLEKLFAIGLISFCAIFLNAILNYLFMKMGMGIKGLALATSIAYYALVVGGAFELRRLGIRVFSKSAWQVLLISLGISVAALGVTWLIPAGLELKAGLVLRGAAFLATVGILLFLTPNKAVSNCRDTIVRDILR